MYLLFLSHVLSITNKFNILFQSNSAVVHVLYAEMSAAYKSILAMYMNISYVKITPVKDLNPESSVNYSPINTMYLVVHVAKLMCRSDVRSEQSRLNEFFYRCRSFLVALPKEIRARLPFECDFFQLVQILDPQVAISGSIPSLLLICNRFPTFWNLQEAEEMNVEWRTFPFSSKVDEIIQHEPTIGTEAFWGKISKLRNDSGQLVYPLVSEVALSLLILPVSNASCERVFSSVHAIKTKSRNRFSTDGVASLIFAQQALKGNCSTFCTID